MINMLMISFSVVLNFLLVANVKIGYWFNLVLTDLFVTDWFVMPCNLLIAVAPWDGIELPQSHVVESSHAPVTIGYVGDEW